MFAVDYRALVSSSDILYRSPAATPDEGQPIGNGRMGTLVWTTPEAIHFQINRSDVFAVDSSHGGPYGGPTDYCGACAQVTVEVGAAVFAPSETFAQRLSLYDAATSICGAGVDVTCFIASDRDVLVVEIDDRRPSPPPLRVRVIMWRAPEVLTGEHAARLAFQDEDARILLQQHFEERNYRCASAVAAQIVGRPATLENGDERTRTLVAPGCAGRTVVLVASAADRSPRERTADTAVRLLEEAAGQTVESLHQHHASWWHALWSRTFIQLHSPDGIAEFMERIRNLNLYCMAATSRGLLPPKFNGMLFLTEGDRRAWGSQFWLWNTDLMYYPLFAADADDLMEPYFDMYWRMLSACEAAAKQRWGLKGAFYPETMPFDGPRGLPDDIAQEFQDVILGRKPDTEFLPRARECGQFCSQLSTLSKPRPPETTPDWGRSQAGRYSWVSHIVTGALELGQQFWWRYRYTGDLAWLRDRAYPMLKAGMEFYRSLAKREADGHYHLYPTNARERFWGVRDSIVDLAALRGAGPLAIKAAEMLGLDEDLRGKWRELLDNLTPYPMGSEPNAKALTGGVLANDVWAAARLGDVDDSRNGEDVWASPLFPFEHVTLASEDAGLLAQVARVCSLLGYEGGGWSRAPIRVARAGDAAHLPIALATMYANTPGQLPSGLSSHEGPQGHGVEHLASIATGLQDALMQSLSSRPGEPELILLFPAWPCEWDGAFCLLARGGFLVTSERRGGSIRFVQIDSRAGETCRIRNPWNHPCILVDSDGGRFELSGPVIQFATRAHGRYLVYPATQPEPQPERLAVQPLAKPDGFRFTMPDGRTLEGRIGKQS
ncbi:MAG: DUF5703 domain-containing protein [Verrucomicrobiae bacterium]